MSFQDAIQAVSGKSKKVSGKSKSKPKARVGLMQVTDCRVSGVKRKTKVSGKTPPKKTGIGSVAGYKHLARIDELEKLRKSATSKTAKDLIQASINKEHDKLDAVIGKLSKR